MGSNGKFFFFLFSGWFLSLGSIPLGHGDGLTRQNQSVTRWQRGILQQERQQQHEHRVQKGRTESRRVWPSR